MTLTSHWGYGTKKDNEKWTAHICEECVDKKLDFIKFRKQEMISYSVVGTEEDLEEKLKKEY